MQFPLTCQVSQELCEPWQCTLLTAAPPPPPKSNGIRITVLQYMWVIKLLWRASATEMGTVSLCDPAEIQLSVQCGQSTTAPKESTSVVLGLISKDRGKSSCLFMHLLHLEEDHSCLSSLRCCMSSLISTLVCRPSFHSKCFNHDAVKSDVSTKSMVFPSLPKNNLLHTV